MHNPYSNCKRRLLGMLILMGSLHVYSQTHSITKTDPHSPSKPIQKARPREETIIDVGPAVPVQTARSTYQRPAPVDPVLRITDPAKIAEIRTKYASESTPNYLEWMRKGNPAGLAGIKRGLQSKDRDENFRTLEAVTHSGSEAPVTMDAETYDLVYGFLQDTGACRYPAIKALVLADRNRAVEPLMKFIDDEAIDANTRAYAITCLGIATATPASIAFLGKLLQLGPESELRIYRESMLLAISRLHVSGTDADRKQIESKLKPLLLPPATPTLAVISLIDQLALHPSEAMLPAFERFQDDEQVGESSRKAIVQLRGAAARPMVQALLENPQDRMFGLSLVPMAWKQDPEAGLEILQETFARPMGPQFPEFYVDACWKTCGAKLTQQFVAALPDSSKRNKCQNYLQLAYLPIDAQHPLWQKSQALYSAGILVQPYTLQQLEEIRNTRERRFVIDFSRVLLRQMQGFADVYAWNSSFTDVHELILHGFLPAAGTQFADVACYQHRERKAIDRYDVSVWLVHHGVAYALAGAPYDTSIPLSSLATLLNALLADAHVKERFVAVSIHGATYYMYMLPEKVVALEAALA